ncbi:MAG: FliM/FliN family flagellar motor switch protein [Planctomycetota bacterium]
MPTDFRTILKLDVPIIVEIGKRRLAVQDVLNWAPGAIIELDKNADDELAVCINNKPIGTGAAVKVGENYGIRLNDIAPPSERVRAMGE